MAELHMSTTTDYAQPRRIDWDMLLTRLCGVCALLATAMAETLSERLYWLAVTVWGWV